MTDRLQEHDSGHRTLMLVTEAGVYCGPYQHTGPTICHGTADFRPFAVHKRHLNTKWMRKQNKILNDAKAEQCKKITLENKIEKSIIIHIF